VQVKNRKDCNANYPVTATSYLSLKAAGIKINHALPYLSLYMSLGPRTGPEDSVIEMPVPRRYLLRSIKSEPCPSRQTCLAVFTVTREAYRVVGGGIGGLLNQIGQC
jgi:hypothetical protein